MARRFSSWGLSWSLCSACDVTSTVGLSKEKRSQTLYIPRHTQPHLMLPTLVASLSVPQTGMTPRALLLLGFSQDTKTQKQQPSSPGHDHDAHKPHLAQVAAQRPQAVQVLLAPQATDRAVRGHPPLPLLHSCRCAVYACKGFGP